MKISAIIITRNEEVRIATCLSSVGWADEVIVVDNGSTDGTREVAREKGAVVISAGDTRDFAGLRNRGKDNAQSEWLLYIDADEVVTDELAKEIKESVSRQQPARNATHSVAGGSATRGYELRRKNYYLGHEWPGDEYILRLMRKDALAEWYGELHETARITGEIGRLNAPLLHDTHRSLGEMVTKTNEWSQAEARLRFDAGHPPVVWWRFIRVMMTAFFNSFIRQGGWRVGIIGWIESMYQAFSIFITYAKLWEMQQTESQKS